MSDAPPRSLLDVVEILEEVHRLPVRTQDALMLTSREARETLTRLRPPSLPPGVPRHMLCDVAARQGDLPLLKWAHQHGGDVSKVDVRQVATQGHLHVLMWMRSVGYLYKPQLLEAVPGAIEGNQLELVRWLHARKAPIDAKAVALAARLGHLEVLKFLNDAMGGGDEGTLRAAEAAAANNQLHVLEWLLQQGHHFTPNAYTHALQGGHMGVVTWLHKHGCEWNEMTLYTVIEFGDKFAMGTLELVKWFHSKGCPLSDAASQRAAMDGRLDVLEYLDANNCPFTGWACEFAAQNGHLDVVKMLVARGHYPLNETLMAYSVASGNFELVSWLYTSDCPMNELATSAAAGAGNLWLLTWLVDKECPVNELAAQEAARYGKYEVYDWLVQRGFPVNSRTRDIMQSLRA